MKILHYNAVMLLLRSLVPEMTCEHQPHPLCQLEELTGNWLPIKAHTCSACWAAFTRGAGHATSMLMVSHMCCEPHDMAACMRFLAWEAATSSLMW